MAKRPLISTSKDLNRKFCHLINDNKLEEAKELIKTNPDLIITIGWFFGHACGKGHFVAARRMATLVNIKELYLTSACINACGRGRMKVLYWLISIADEDTLDYERFVHLGYMMACHNGLVTPIKWLLENIYSNICLDDGLLCSGFRCAFREKGENSELVNYLKNYNNMFKNEYDRCIQQNNLTDSDDSDSD